MISYIHIGKIVATFGVNGEVVLKHSLNKKSNFKNTTVIFIELVKGNKIPFFIAQAKAKNIEESYILLEGINNKEAAHKLIGKTTWLTEDDFRVHAGKQAPIGLLGYNVIEDNVVLGSVLEVIEQPHQVLLCINYKNNDAFIPLHTETLIKINHSKKEVFVKLPEGLLDVYTT